MPLDETSRRLFLKSSLAAGALPLIVASDPSRAADPQAPLVAYVGTFSSPLTDVLPTQVDLPPGNGRGIHRFKVDRTTGALTPDGIVESGTSPSCLVINADGDRIYSANETDRFQGGLEGTVSAFAIDRATGGLTLLNTIRSGGAGPTYVAIHPAGKHLLVANYFGGSIAVLPILADGRLGEPSDVKEDSGKIGPTRAKNAPPGSFAFSGHDRTHAHMIQADPAGRFVIHVDLGLDQILVWKFDPQTGKLAPASKHIVSLPPGFAGSNFCSEILVSSDGKFVYAGNRLHDSIGIFKIADDGTLTHVADEWTRGNYPRSFGFDPTGNFLYCCNQRGDNVATFKVDRETGMLAFTGQYTGVGNPSIIVFLELNRTD